MRLMKPLRRILLLLLATSALFLASCDSSKTTSSTQAVSEAATAYPAPEVWVPVAPAAGVYPAPGEAAAIVSAYPAPVEAADAPAALPTEKPEEAAPAQPAPRTELVATDPATVSLASGKVQLVEFFAFW